MPKFNIILGRDFLNRYEVEIEYKRKKVKFTLEDGDMFNFD